MLKKSISILIIAILLGFSSFAYAKDAAQEYQKTQLLMGNPEASETENFSPLNAEVSRCQANCFNESLLPLYKSSNFYVCDILKKNLGLIESQCISSNVTFIKSLIKTESVCAIIYVDNPAEKIEFIKYIVSNFNAQPFRDIKVNISFSGAYGFFGAVFSQSSSLDIKGKDLNTALHTAYDIVKEINKVPYGANCTVIMGFKKYFPNLFGSIPNKKFSPARICLDITVISIVNNKSFELYDDIFDYAKIDLK